MKILNMENYIIKCGQNKNENEKIIKESEKNDLWFHLDKMPSPHVVMSKINIDYKWTNNDYTNAAKICKENSKAKNWSVNVIMTTIDKIKMTEKIGEVDIIGKVKKIKI